MRGLRFGASLAALVQPKARLRVEGAANALATLAPTPPDRDCYWMHCASVGEFEQGRPVWEEIRRREPGARFVLTFFSPSGVEWFGGRGDFGEVTYLPWDTGGAAAAFVGRLSPKLALFVKYEWWLGYHAALRELGVPTVLFSVAFRQNQPFFRRAHPLHHDYRVALGGVSHVFVQGETSLELLRGHGYTTPASRVGDTRLDRVLAVRDGPYREARLERWTQPPGVTMVAGSTWPPDEAILYKVLSEAPALRLVCAPHEVDAAARARLLSVFAEFDPVLFSKTQDDWSAANRVVVLDAKGVLAKAYRYGDLAYVGGGFGSGIHNTLEPMVYGLPVAFGPRYARFDEAIALVAEGIAWPRRDAADLCAFVQRFGDAAARRDVLAKAEAYLARNRGASAAIIAYLVNERLL